MDTQLYNKLYEILRKLSYEKQDHWDVFDTIYYEKIKDIDNLYNFRNNGISNMLETGLPSQDRAELLRDNLSYNTNYNDDEKLDIISRYNELIIILYDGYIQPHRMAYLNSTHDFQFLHGKFNNNVGNPRHLLHDNILLNFDDLYHVYALSQINRWIHNSKVKPDIIVEIGGGYGNFAYKFKDSHKAAKYVIVDLPEVLLLQHYYLMQMNPDFKIVNLIDQSINIDVENDSFDYLLIPYNVYQNYNFKFDIVVNKRSLGEMPKAVLENYFTWIQKNLRDNGLFYLVNRYAFTKSNDKNKLRDYPFDKHWNVLLSHPQWLQTHLHEFMLERTPDINNNLSRALKSFPLSTPPPGPIMKDTILKQSDWIKYQNIN
jgi:putative sugar O-methyltransferase